MAEAPPTSVHVEVPVANPTGDKQNHAASRTTTSTMSSGAALASTSAPAATNSAVSVASQQDAAVEPASSPAVQPQSVDETERVAAKTATSFTTEPPASVPLPLTTPASTPAAMPAASSSVPALAHTQATAPSTSAAPTIAQTEPVSTVSSFAPTQRSSAPVSAASEVASDRRPEETVTPPVQAAVAQAPPAHSQQQQPPPASAPLAASQAPTLSAPQAAPTDALQATREALGRRDFQAATASVEGYLTTAPQDPEAWLLLGQVHFECGSHADALAAYSKAMELRPGDYRVWFNIGELYSACEQHQDAHTAYTHALSLPGVDIEKLQQRLERTHANIRAQQAAEGNSGSNAPPASSQAPPPAPAPASAPMPPSSTAPPAAPPAQAPKPAAPKPGPVVTTRPEPQRTGTAEAPNGAPQGAAPEEAAYTVVPPRLQAGNYESSRGESSFCTMGGATVHNPKQSIPPARVQVTTGAGNMGKFTCLAAPLSTLQEHTVPSQLQQTPTLQELLQDTPRALQQAQGLPQGDPSLQLPVIKDGTIWLLPVSVLRLWFLLAISDHSRHTAHKLYPDQHPPPPGLPPIHYNLLSADAQPAITGVPATQHQQQEHPHAPPAPFQQQGGPLQQQGGPPQQHGGVKRPRDAPHQQAGPAFHEERAPMFQVSAPAAPTAPAASSSVQGDGGVTVSQARAMFGARFPNRMRGKKGIRLMGVPPPSKNTSTEAEDRRQAAAVHAMANCMGTSAVHTALLNSACALLSATKPGQARTAALGASPPQWAQTVVQNVQPAVSGVEMRLLPNEPPAEATHRILLRVPAWPYKRRVHRREARLSRLLAAGAQDVQPDDEIGSVDTVIDENDERLVPVQPMQPQKAASRAGRQQAHSNGPAPAQPQGRTGPPRPTAQQQAKLPAGQPGQGAWPGQAGMDPAGMPMAGGPAGDPKSQSQPVMSARDFMPPGATGGMHPGMHPAMPRGSGGMDMHPMQAQGMHMGGEGPYGAQGGMPQYHQQGGAPPHGMHPGMGMPPGAYAEHGQHGQYPPGGNPAHMQGQPYGAQPPGAGYHAGDHGMQQQQQQQQMRGPGGMPPSQGYGMYPGQGPPMQQGPEGAYGGFSGGMPTPYHGGHAPPPHGHAPPSHAYAMQPGGQYYEQAGGPPPGYGGQGPGFPQGQQQGYGAPPQHYAGQFQYYR